MLLLAAGTFGGACPGATEDRQPAVWKPRESTFSFVGFTSRYSCEALRDKIEQALITLGARRDLIVTPYPCAGVGRPEFAPSLQIKVSTLEPAMTNAPGGTIEAHWETVSLVGTGKLSPGECELAEQIRGEILPLFTTRNLSAKINCIPHQESAGSMVLTVDVLVPAQ
jgi:hypothetical protein